MHRRWSSDQRCSVTILGDAVLTPARALRAAAARLAPPGVWLPTSANARTAEGLGVQAHNPDAVAWGVLWALVAVGAGPEVRMAALAALKTVTGVKFVCDWTAADARTQAEVLDALERAAVEAEDAGDRRAA